MEKDGLGNRLGQGHRITPSITMHRGVEHGEILTVGALDTWHLYASIGKNDLEIGRNSKPFEDRFLEPAEPQRKKDPVKGVVIGMESAGGKMENGLFKSGVVFTSGHGDRPAPTGDLETLRQADVQAIHERM